MACRATRRSGGSSIHAGAIAPPSIRAALRVREHVAWPMPVARASRRHAAACVRLVRRHRAAMGAARWLGPDARTRRDLGRGAEGTIGHGRPPRSCVASAGASTLVIGGRYLAPRRSATAPPSRSGLARPTCPRCTLAPGAFAHTWTLPAGTHRADRLRAADGAAVSAPRRRARPSASSSSSSTCSPRASRSSPSRRAGTSPNATSSPAGQWRWVGDESRRAHRGGVRRRPARDRGHVSAALRSRTGPRDLRGRAAHCIAYADSPVHRGAAHHRLSNWAPTGASRGVFRRRSSPANGPARPTRGDSRSRLRRCTPTPFVDTTTTDR